MKAGMARGLFAGVVAFAPITFFILSTASIRLKTASFYKDNNQYAESVKICEKILRKDLVKPELSAQKYAQVNFELGGLTARLGFTDAAVEAYARAAARFPEQDIAGYYCGTNLDHDRLPAVGLLEAGYPDRAAREFRRLASLYPDFRDAGRYISAAEDMRKRGIAPGGENFYFSAGDGYIENGLFEEARAFFTKRISDYGVGAFDTLAYLDKKYSRETEVISKVWGDDIYVVLEDFEASGTRLKRFFSNASARAIKHLIVKESVRKSGHSEFLDIDYAVSGYDYWERDVKVPLSAPDLSLGIRMLIKSGNPSGRTPFFWVSYGPEPGLTGICNPPQARRDLGNGWEEWKIEGLVESARDLALKRGWSTDNMVMDRVIIDMQGISGDFYIDEIDLYLKDRS